MATELGIICASLGAVVADALDIEHDACILFQHGRCVCEYAGTLCGIMGALVAAARARASHACSVEVLAPASEQYRGRAEACFFSRVPAWVHWLWMHACSRITVGASMCAVEVEARERAGCVRTAQRLRTRVRALTTSCANMRVAVADAACLAS